MERQKAAANEDQARKEVERLQDKLVEAQARYREKSENEIAA